jgi:hypothetical protein
MAEEIHTDLHLAEMEQQDAEAYARQPQDPDEIAAREGVQDLGDAGGMVMDGLALNEGPQEDFRLWLAKCEALVADISTRRKGQPLDIDALLQADRADLEARDAYIIKGATP